MSWTADNFPGCDRFSSRPLMSWGDEGEARVSELSVTIDIDRGGDWMVPVVVECEIDGGCWAASDIGVSNDGNEFPLTVEERREAAGLAKKRAER